MKSTANFYWLRHLPLSMKSGHNVT
uniref:Uncharacterized protein n=1 Tax=Triticum urartu TaxID=4572 RepID=A0A8R7TJB6_TRIUA